MSAHPNFPPSLSIAPNFTASGLQRLSGLRGKDAFGVEAQREAIEKYGIAGRVWEAAYALSNYVTCNGALEFEPQFIDDKLANVAIVAIELGSGTGIVSARLAQSISSSRLDCIIATDLPDVCPLLERNLHGEFAQNHVFVRPLAWGNLDHAKDIAVEFGLSQTPDVGGSSRQLTHIICSDLASVYFPELLGPLLRSLIHLTSPFCTASSTSTPIKIIISYKVRSLSKETPFWAAFGLWFYFEPVLARRVHATDECERGPWRQYGADDADRTFIFIGYRRPESMLWEVPESDMDLIDGVGAQGTAMKKADDTFETILFMGIDDTP
ncbi:hypothetical protein HYDPIDRAFT_128613 [Hydnomerulius pinastri MD-312]|nr:hypothetical protein HYDPIDRAFT_128613 [Hydnomerulius pinastri MD-312]